MSVRTQGCATRTKLLEAAGAVFPERGYRDATTAEICAKAGVNGAAINYHFGGKQALYVEVWRVLLQEALAHTPPEAGLDPEAPPEQRLRARIRTLLGHMTQGGPVGRLVLHELIQPTGLIDDLRREVLAPVREGMSALLRTLLGPLATDRDVALCELSVVNQCLALRLRPLHLNEILRHDADPLDLDELADHVTCFSLAGIRRVRSVVESRRG